VLIALSHGAAINGGHTITGTTSMLKWLLITLGCLSLFSGMLTFWLPLPIGIPLILMGTALLVRHSPHARQQITHLARRNPRVLGVLNKICKTPPEQAKSSQHRN
jgi:hypothetical protein